MLLQQQDQDNALFSFEELSVVKRRDHHYLFFFPLVFFFFLSVLAWLLGAGISAMVVSSSLVGGVVVHRKPSQYV